MCDSQLNADIEFVSDYMYLIFSNHQKALKATFTYCLKNRSTLGFTLDNRQD